MKPNTKRLVAGSLLAAILIAFVTLPLIVSAAPPERPAYSLTDDLVAYWKMDQASGSRSESTGGCGAAEEVGGTVSSATGKISNAAALVKANNRVLRVSDASCIETGTDGMTISEWVYFTTLPSGEDWSISTRKYNPSSTQYVYGVYFTSAHQFKFQKSNTGNTGDIISVTTSGLSISSGEWHYVVSWLDTINDEIGIQVDDGTVFTTATTTSIHEGNGHLVFGAAIDNGTDTRSQIMDGRIDEVGIWHRALTAGERYALWNSGAGCTYPLNTCGAVATHTPTPTRTPTAAGTVAISLNYIDQGSFEFGPVINSPWDLNITNSSVRRKSVV